MKWCVGMNFSAALILLLITLCEVFRPDAVTLKVIIKTWFLKSQLWLTPPRAK